MGQSHAAVDERLLIEALDEMPPPPVPCPFGGDASWARVWKAVEESSKAMTSAMMTVRLQLSAKVIRLVFSRPIPRCRRLAGPVRASPRQWSRAEAEFRWT